jgi:hypothetical protein
METGATMTRGGTRKGAGRPKSKGIVLQIKITPEQKAWIQQQAKDGDMTMSDVVLECLRLAGAPVSP